MNNYHWDSHFTDLFSRCVDLYNSGNTDFSSYYSEDDLALLASFGYKTREFFDFVEDHAGSGGTNPSSGTALLIASVRRDFFRTVQKGQPEHGLLTPEDLPSRDSDLGGYTWLPRIIAKARAKLHGTLDPEIMFGCGGDRAFLSRVDIHPADFLRAVWAARDDDQKILAYIQENAV